MTPALTAAEAGHDLLLTEIGVPFGCPHSSDELPVDAAASPPSVMSFWLLARFRAWAHLPDMTDNAWARTLSSDWMQEC